VEEVVQQKSCLQHDVSIRVHGGVVNPIVEGRGMKMVKALGHEAVMR
jgi:hypothetical protein